jgi:hypothetical protein
MAEILGWVGNKKFYLKNSKIEIFLKSLPRFAVPSTTKILKKTGFKIFLNYGKIQDGRFLTFHFQKINKNY